MQIGIIGTESDLRCQGLERFLSEQDAKVVFVNSRSFEQQEPWSFDGQSFFYKGQLLDQVAAWYFATYPPALPPAWTDFKEHFLYKDWFVNYMQLREHRNFTLAWLLSLQRRGIPIINPPEYAVGQQLKTLELFLARQLGLETPRTLISNDPQQVRTFMQEVEAPVYKPLIGYGHCKPLTQAELPYLERIKAAPVIFQERVPGVAVRVTCVDGQIVSAVKIPSESLDYRDNASYEAGQQIYEPIQLPPEIIKACQQYLAQTGLLLAGIDFMLTPEGRYVFLEANSSPMYIEIEMRTRSPITYEICTCLLKYANDPQAYAQAIQGGRQLQGFVSYSLPFGENLWT